MGLSELFFLLPLFDKSYSALFTPKRQFVSRISEISTYFGSLFLFPQTIQLFNTSSGANCTPISKPCNFLCQVLKRHALGILVTQRFSENFLLCTFDWREILNSLKKSPCTIKNAIFPTRVHLNRSWRLHGG